MGPRVQRLLRSGRTPEGFAEAHGYEIWTDRDGRRVPTTVLSSSVGAAHCDWQTAHFLRMGRRADGRTYVRDPEGLFSTDTLSAPYDGDVRMPEGARDTGYRFHDWQLWFTPDRSTAYVRTPGGVEAWPSAPLGIACQ